MSVDPPGVDLFDDDPGACAYGHYFGPGKVRRGWQPCGCRAAQANGNGHHYIVCNQCEAEGRREFIFLPPCDDDCELRQQRCRLSRPLGRVPRDDFATSSVREKKM